MDSYCEDFIKQSEDFFGEVHKANKQLIQEMFLARRRKTKKQFKMNNTIHLLVQHST